MPPKKSSNGQARAAENKITKPKTASVQSGAVDLTSNSKRSESSAGGKNSAKDTKNSAKKSSGSAKSSAKSTGKPTGSAKNTAKSTEKSSGSAKSTAKSTGKPTGSAKKSPQKTKSEPSVESGISCKTPQVMKLVEKDKGENAVIAAGKSRIPSRLKGREPLSKIVKREARNDVFEQSEAEVVNLTELAVQYEAPQILDRFNACSCEKCVAVFSEMVLKILPARFARITKTKMGIRSRELSGRVEPVREMVQITMIREIIRSKKRIFHDE